MLISFTGADDNTDLNRFVNIARRAADKKLLIGDGILVEAGVLFFPEKMGQPRNPSFNTRHTLYRSMSTAAHLCGSQIFDTFLSRNETNAQARNMQYLVGELDNYDRIQVNINARGRKYTTEEVHDVYFQILETVKDTRLILQLHEDSADDIRSFVQRLKNKDYGHREPKNPVMQILLPDAYGAFHRNSLQRIQILVDSSRGRGTAPEKWIVQHAEEFKDMPLGIAGSLGPGRHVSELMRFAQDTGLRAAWIDMESGPRTDNQFDLDKMQRVIDEVQEALTEPAQPETTT